MFGDVTVVAGSSGGATAHEAGGTLEAVLRRERAARLTPRSLEQTMALLRPVADTLAALHARGESHRDLRPATIVVVGDPRGEPGRVTARLATGMGPAVMSGPAGTAYRAPEQFSEAYGVIGPWTDVFALALLVVSLLSVDEPRGRFLDFSAVFSNDGEASCAPESSLTGRRREAHEASDAVDAVLVRALSVYPAERYQTVAAFWAALGSATRRDASFAA